MEVYHLLGKIGWWTVIVNGTRQILNGNFHRDALVPFPRLFLKTKGQGRSKPKGLELVKTSKWNTHFPFRNSGFDPVNKISGNFDLN